jgi:hypothetical protein
VPTPPPPSRRLRALHALRCGHRFLALATLLPMAAAWAGGQMPWVQPWFAGPAWPLVAGGVALPLFAVLLMAFPRALIETLGLAIATTVVATVTPSAAALVGVAPAHSAVPATIIITLLHAPFWFCLWLGATALLESLRPRRFRSLRLSASVRTDLPPEAALDALAPPPGRATGRIRTGPADAEGWYELAQDIADVERTTLAPTTSRVVYRQTILEDAPGRRVIQYLAPIEGGEASGVTEITCEATPRGTICRSRDVTALFGPVELLGWWLVDLGRDSMISRLENHAGRPSPAIIDRPMDSPLALLMRVGGQDPDAL